MLGKESGIPNGLDLPPHYLDACPQALVFVLTGMDVESLATSGDIDWHYVDAIIPKRRLGSLWWHYARCFKKKFGNMFWHLWSGECKEEYERKLLRSLYGTLHQWQMEPNILTCGQGVAELIDHADRHVAHLWRLLDSIIGTLYDNWPVGPGEIMTAEDRVALALAVWLHDIGHRGDRYCADSISIRDNHAAISEYLILKNPDAYGLAWLRCLCSENCKERDKGSQARLKNRNSGACNRDSGLCLLRKMTLLCRHHQSNAPLTSDALGEIQKKGKTLSPYSRISIPADKGRERDSERDLTEWMDLDQPLSSWLGSDVKCLESFITEDSGRFLGMTGLLRFLDGIQLHKERVGSPLAVKSFNELLSLKDEWAQRQIDIGDRVLQQSSAGTRAYHQVLSERFKLDGYLRVVRSQFIHYWRQISVSTVNITWRWLSSGKGALDIEFLLDDYGLNTITAMRPHTAIRGREISFELLSNLNEKVEELKKKDKNLKEIFCKIQSKCSGDDLCLPAIWAVHVRDNVIDSEVSSQSFKDKPPLFQNLFPKEVSLRVVLTGTVYNPFDEPIVLYSTLPSDP